METEMNQKTHRVTKKNEIGGVEVLKITHYKEKEKETELVR